MERTVPRTDSDEIDLYIRTYYSLLRSTGEISLSTLVESHIGMASVLHPDAGKSHPDVSALVYASLRLPSCITRTRLVLLGQRRAVFQSAGYAIEEWDQVSAIARRRRTYFNGEDTLAMYIASRSDIDDIIPVLTAYQIEWNKIHRRLTSARGQSVLADLMAQDSIGADDVATLADMLGISTEDFQRLQMAWGDETIPCLFAMGSERKNLSLRLMAGSLADYRKATQYWWSSLSQQVPQYDFADRRVYFVSSNLHALANLWSGYGLRQQKRLLEYIEEVGHEYLLSEFEDIERRALPSSRQNFFYYALKQYLDDFGQDARAARKAEEQEVGLYRLDSIHGFDVDAQVIELSKCRPDWMDDRVVGDGIEALKSSTALIYNIDYPLGLAAYEILTRITENVGQIAGIYVMGKAATLNGRVGDVMIPNVVHDEHSINTFMLNNAFTADDVDPYLTYGTVLDNQKSVTVRGTFLQNPRYMGVFYREGYTDIEMEAGPYLSAVYELIRPKRHPQDEIVSLHSAEFDVGLIHYASDKPLSKGKNLGAGSLSYRGMDPTYAAAVAILRRIISQEIRYQMKTH